jgi:ABC-type transport system involved in multi-copper enzyme maturation permease subunit
VLLSIALSAAVCFAVGTTFDGWPAERQARFTPILMSVTGHVVLLIAASVFGVLVSANEYSSGMIRLTLTATPRRTRVLLAKLVLVSGVTLGVGLFTVTAMFLVGQATLGAYGIPQASLGDADAQRLVIGLGAATPLFPILGFALGVILRSTAGAITAALGLLWLPQVFGEVLPAWPQEHILSLTPQSGADSMTVSHLAESALYSAPATGAVIVAVWLVVFIGGAYLTLRRRDA